MPAWIQSVRYSLRTSASEAPIEETLTNPCTPGVEGKIWEKPYQNPGILLCGHTMPEAKKRMRLKKAKQSRGETL